MERSLISETSVTNLMDFVGVKGQHQECELLKKHHNQYILYRTIYNSTGKLFTASSLTSGQRNSVRCPYLFGSHQRESEPCPTQFQGIIYCFFKLLL